MPLQSAELDRHPRFAYGLPVWNWLFYRTVWALIGIPHKLLFRLQGKGQRATPRDGSLLLLGNHTTMLDPFWVGWLPVRPFRFMASAQVFRLPVLGRFLGIMGAFPKMKYVKDRESMQILQDYYDRGMGVVIFPEGRRSWDGRTLPVLPGIGRLIKRTNARVVYARTITGYLVQPRWSPYPRYVPVIIEYNGPHTYPPDMTEEEIVAHVQRHIDTVPRIPPGTLTFGFRMAEGLPTFLWACPSCFALDALQVRGWMGNTVACTCCHATWRLDTSCVLHGQAGASTLSVAEARDALCQHFGTRPRADEAQLQAEGIALSSPDVSIGRLRKGLAPEAMGRGRLVLTAEGLTLFNSPDGAPTWGLRLEDIRACSVEFGNKLQLRTESELFQVDAHGNGRLMWAHFISGWLGGDMG